MANYIKPELLAPAGDFDKLKVCFLYGADAVYAGASNFGLRSSAGNFTISELIQATKYAKKLNKKIYLVVNTLPHNNEIDDIEKFLINISGLGLDALIISDAGVISLAKEHTNFDIHLSTQASAINYEAVSFWKKHGIKRIILGRETSLIESYEIFDKTAMDLEIFVHGSMCMSYSGKCTISNYISLRDANRGGCTNSCRWEYAIKNNPQYTKLHPLNSRDLWAIELIPEIVSTQKIASLKIEGRMKNHLYLANTVSVYRKAIDHCYENITHNKALNSGYHKIINSLKKELKSNMNRTFTTGFLKKRAGYESILYNNRESSSYYINLGSVIKKIDNNTLLIDTKNTCKINDNIELIFSKIIIKHAKIKNITDMAGNNIEIIPNNRLAYITIDINMKEDVHCLTVIRKALSKENEYAVLE